MLTNSQYNQIMREYEAIQSRNRRVLREHIDEVYSKIPEMEELDNRAGSSAVSRFRAYSSGDEKAIDNFDKEIEDIQKEKTRLLKENGFPEDYLELKYECESCEDTGYLKDGSKCSCLKNRERKLLYAQSRLDRILEKENFDTLSFEYYDDSNDINGTGMSQREYMEKIVQLCRKTNGSVLFTGSTGTGKTFLSNCIADRRMKAGDSVIYLTAVEFFDIIGKVRIDKTEDMSVQELYDRIFDCDLLIIDDLGSELVNSMTNSNLFYILNSRLLNGRATIISTNLGLNAMRDIYSERVTSRIRSEFDIIPLYGDDIRLKR